jgi:putative transposase
MVFKYECVYLHAFETGSESRRGIENWMEYYNQRRPHSSLDGRTPYEAYWELPMAGLTEAAA